MERKIRLNESIGLQLKEFRTTYQIKAKDVAEMLGKSRAYISKLESGQIRQIEKKEFVRITNYITKTDDGYAIFCERVADKANVNELEHDNMLLNFDFVDRKIPVSKSLIDDLKKRIDNLGISSEELAAYINQNEDLGPNFFKEHNINPDSINTNTWLPYTEADSVELHHFYIVVEIESNRIDDLLSGKIRKCNYLLPYAIMYHILKWPAKETGIPLDEKTCDNYKSTAEKLLLQHKFYSLSVQAKLKAQSKSKEEYNRLLSEFDQNNIEYVSSILNAISFLSRLDISYTNDKLKSIDENMRKCDPSFALAFMSTSLTEIKDLPTSAKKEFLQKVNDLVNTYTQKSKAGDIIEKY